MAASKTAILRWARGQKAAQQRIAAEARRGSRSLKDSLDRVDDLRRFADDLGAAPGAGRAAAENLAFHVTWARVRRAFGVG